MGPTAIITICKYQRCTGSGFQDSSLEGFISFGTIWIGSGLGFF